MDESQKQNFKCIKCGNSQCEVGEFRAAGGFWSKLFDIQGRRFKTVSCTQCGYTEVYSGAKSKGIENVADFLAG